MIKTASEQNFKQEFKMGSYQSRFESALESLRRAKFVQRLWAKDPTLWKSDPAHTAIIKNSLGWLKVAEWMEPRMEELAQFAVEVKKDGFTDVLLLGMGGSSLAPEVFRRSLPAKKGYPKLHVLDSTDPGWVRKTEKSVNLSKTLFVVASKSGTTIEPLCFYNYFFNLAKENGSQFVAITDPGSYLEEVAKKERFKKIFLNPSDIGGRFSALSYFGMVPAALAGMDVQEIIERAIAMGKNSGSGVSLMDNQPVALGAAIGELAKAGRDKLTLVLPKAIASFGLWIEQLVAESSGKEGKGIVPIADERLAEPALYGDDRMFVAVSCGKKDEAAESRLAALEKKHPVIRIQIEEPLDLGAEMLRWEIATATACSLLAINAFDQPDVQSAKTAAKNLLQDLQVKGSLSMPKAQLKGDKFEAAFSPMSRKANELPEFGAHWLSEFCGRAEARDYVGILAYLPFERSSDEALSELREAIRNATKKATLFGYGPRYLHSTGQLYKGGANNGVFVIITGESKPDIKVPQEKFTFGQLEMAQASGDFEALSSKGRRAVWIRLKGPAAPILKKLAQSIK